MLTISRVPDVIKPVLDEYISMVQHRLPDLVTGVYILGSIALDAFNERLSDIDFMTLLNRSCTEDDLQQLEEIHQAMAG
jgi:hypothetical protein